MGNITDKLEFKGKWKIYQQRVLEQLGYYFADRKLHVVVAP